MNLDTDTVRVLRQLRVDGPVRHRHRRAGGVRRFENRSGCDNRTSRDERKRPAPQLRRAGPRQSGILRLWKCHGNWRRHAARQGPVSSTSQGEGWPFLRICGCRLATRRICSGREPRSSPLRSSARPRSVNSRHTSNLGYTFSSDVSDEAKAAFVGAPPDEFDYSFGADVAVTPRVTFAADLIGRSLIDVRRLVDQELDVSFQDGRMAGPTQVANHPRLCHRARRI